MCALSLHALIFVAICFVLLPVGCNYQVVRAPEACGRAEFCDAYEGGRQANQYCIQPRLYRILGVSTETHAHTRSVREAMQVHIHIIYLLLFCQAR